MSQKNNWFEWLNIDIEWNITDIPDQTPISVNDIKVECGSMIQSPHSMTQLQYPIVRSTV